jgi:hypothetical protein
LLRLIIQLAIHSTAPTHIHFLIAALQILYLALLWNTQYTFTFSRPYEKMSVLYMSCSIFAGGLFYIPTSEVVGKQQSLQREKKKCIYRDKRSGEWRWKDGRKLSRNDLAIKKENYILLEHVSCNNTETEQIRVTTRCWFQVFCGLAAEQLDRWESRASGQTRRAV